MELDVTKGVSTSRRSLTSLSVLAARFSRVNATLVMLPGEIDFGVEVISLIASTASLERISMSKSPAFTHEPVLILYQNSMVLVQAGAAGSRWGGNFSRAPKT